MVCAVLRLARFNVETDEDDSHNYFSGLPSPAAAATVASFPIALNEFREKAIVANGTGQSVAEWFCVQPHMLLPLITLAVAILMVSRFKSGGSVQPDPRPADWRPVIQIVFFAIVFFVARGDAALVLRVRLSHRRPARPGGNNGPPLLPAARTAAGVAGDSFCRQRLRALIRLVDLRGDFFGFFRAPSGKNRSPRKPILWCGKRHNSLTLPTRPFMLRSSLSMSGRRCGQ